MSGFEIHVDLSSLVDGLEEFAAEAELAARPAAQAGAEVLYQVVKANVARLGRVTGNLGSAIYQAYSHDHSTWGKATYHISWNHRKAPHGHLVEFGHLQRYRVILTKGGQWKTLKDHPLPSPKQVAAKPFIRPAAARMPQALEAIEREFLSRLPR